MMNERSLGTLPADDAIEAVASVRGIAPLAVHFALLHSPEAVNTAWVPRALLPPGAFVTAQLTGAAGTAWTSQQVKTGKLKLDPAHSASYVELQPGYAWGVLLLFEGAVSEPGEFTLRLA
ncbi:MAG: hypothetical protein QOJ39_3266, partial [Candidatus Eremiobacteraeota bacterium]|nr:hypothetical protein [Candidatus Eremiobacteraeota bacterium]